MINVQQLFRSEGKAGDIGIEVEVETDRRSYIDLKDIPNWTVHGEGSLKGYGVEYVIITPMKRKHLEKNITDLFNALDKDEANVLQSQNTSVHVHVNVQKLTLESTVRFALYYLLLEPILMKMLDPHRIGNVFCVQSEFVDYTKLLESICRGHVPNLQECKYGSINLGVLKKFGTLEFRALHFPCTKEELIKWVDILLAIRNLAETMDATDFINNLSLMGIVDLVNQYIPELSEAVEQEDQEKVLENMYPYQEIIFNTLGRKDYEDMNEYYKDPNQFITGTFIGGKELLEDTKMLREMGIVRPAPPPPPRLRDEFRAGRPVRGDRY